MAGPHSKKFSQTLGKDPTALRPPHNAEIVGLMPDEGLSDAARWALGALAALAGGDALRAQQLADAFTALLAFPDDADDVAGVHDCLLRLFSGRADPMDFVLEDAVEAFIDFRTMLRVVRCRLERLAEEADAG